MKILDTIRFRMATLFKRSKLNAEMEEELCSHMQHRADDLERSGLSRAEAQRRARLEFGAPARFREESLEAGGGLFLESVLQDLRYAVRSLRRSPGFTIVAVLTLALGIGANSVVFGALNALILRPVNLPNARSLYALERAGDTSVTQTYLSYPDYLDLRDRNRSFDGLATYSIVEVGLDAGEDPERVYALEVSGNYFDVLRIQPYLGRLIHTSDEHGPNSAPYVVLTYSFWHSYFQQDREVVGRTVQLNKHTFTVIGVAPPGFQGTASIFAPDFFVPIVNQEQTEGAEMLKDRGNRWIFQTIGHLKPGVAPVQAIADLNSIGRYLETSYPKDDTHMSFALARPSLVGDLIGHAIAGFVAGLLVLAGLILLAACTNLGNLFAARAADRSREIALRLALGASRVRVLRQIFTEAILISLVGGALGLWGSVLLLDRVSAWRPFPQFPLNLPVTPDANVYGVALLLAIASGFLFGAAPVRQVLRTDPYEIVKAGTIGRPGRRFTLRDAMLAAQIAICAVLVTSSMVAVRGLVRSLHSNFGFEPENAMLVQTVLDMAGYRGDQGTALQKRMIDSMRTIPGVTSVGLVDQPPLHMGWGIANVFPEQATDLRPATARAQAISYSISPEYFDAAKTTLLEGRAFSWNDDKSAPRVAVVNLEFGRRMFGSGASSMGRYFKLMDGTRVQVVGIVEDGKYTANLNEDPQLAVFLPILQSPASETWLVVRSEGNPRELAAAIHSKLHEIDPGLPSFIQTWSESMNGALFAPRMATASLGVLGAMGAMLSVTGIFGLAAYSVSKRKRELGIRMALGARRKEVLKAALGRPFRLLAFGSLSGLVLGLAAGKLLSFIVYQATPRDPLVLTGAVAAMMLVGLVATWIPAQRALGVDPVMLMRED